MGRIVWAALLVATFAVFPRANPGQRASDILTEALRAYSGGDVRRAFGALPELSVGNLVSAANELATDSIKARDFDRAEDLATMLIDASIDAYSRQINSATYRLAAINVATQVTEAGRRGPRLRLWFLLTDAFLEGAWNFYDLEACLELARKAYPKDGQILTISGSLYETRSRAPSRFVFLRVAPQQPVAEYNDRERREDMDRALGYYEAAIKIDARAEETRLRLGRVLLEKKAFTRALAVLQPLAASARQDDTRYLAEIFVAASFEGSGDIGNAKAAYLRGAEWNAEAPVVGLAAVLREEGRTAEAGAVLDRIYASPPPDDPWQHYQKGQWRYLATYLQMARSEARR